MYCAGPRARDQIAVGTLTAAVPGFVDDVLKPEKWSSTPKQPRRRKGAGTTRRPATIRTFFVGYCLYDLGVALLKGPHAACGMVLSA